MFKNFTVKTPSLGNGISLKKIKKATYIYYVYGHEYSKDKRYTVPKNTSIGRLAEDASRMYPNDKYFQYYPDAEMPEETMNTDTSRSSCLRAGAYLVIRKIIAEYHLDEMLDAIIGRDSGLFLDLAAYSIITENNAGQYYPEYAYNHPLFTKDMHVYSDSKVSDFLGSITVDQNIAFQENWNSKRDHREKIYISYDSTNKNCQAGDVDLAEFGHAKDDQDKPIINISMAYDRNNAEPLFYEEYSGSIVDVNQLQNMLEKAKSYGYRKVGFILDRGYFSRENIRYMDKNGYSFIIMMRGMKKLVKSLVNEVKGSFESKREYSIRDYKVSGITVKRKLYESDEKERYFHVFFNEKKRHAEREKLEGRIDRYVSFLQAKEGKNADVSSFTKYFDLIYYHKGKADQKFECARERYDVINEEIELCGYFVIITSEAMTAKEAIELYKGRDASEKLFRADKSFLGNKSFRVYTSESVRAKIFIAFVALIIRNKIYTLLKEQEKRSKTKQNFMTVPAALRELEKIEMIRHSDGGYRLDHAVTATQKEILKAFGMTEATVRERAKVMGEELQRIQEAANGKNAQKNRHRRKNRKAEGSGSVTKG